MLPELFIHVHSEQDRGKGPAEELYSTKLINFVWILIFYIVEEHT